QDGEYDLSGFAVGAVERSHIIDGSAVRPGDCLLGLLSTGLHSNGYSLARKVFFDVRKMDVAAYVPELSTTLAEELLKPTRIYVKALDALRGRVEVKGIAHITGGGIPGNLPRVLPAGVRASIKKGSWPVPPVFGLIGEMGNVPPQDMARTFNMGVGCIMIVPETSSDNAVALLRAAGFDSSIIGSVTHGNKEVTYE
ncbi:MAG TPA: phosphoribosylformylglycinamidine cyclo-ligase, partial [Thermodesulfovibrionales bacterium]|nr:phosphoribosylformylglycinamidine cyclo-ligase [Thermodesulfovibrionales bacterium]